MKSVIIALGLIFSTQALAMQSDLASNTTPVHTETYKFTDGYGTYAGQGSTKLEAHSQAWESCVSNKVAQYESRHGQTPDADTADLFIDACINK
jgi:hypothetical protein